MSKVNKKCHLELDYLKDDEFIIIKQKDSDPTLLNLKNYKWNIEVNTDFQKSIKDSEKLKPADIFLHSLFGSVKVAGKPKTHKLYKKRK